MAQSGIRRASTAAIATVLLLLGACGRAADVAPAPTAPAPPPVTPTSAAPTPTPTAPPSWPDVFDAVSDGVARVAVTTCSNQRSGSAFLVGPNTAVTAAHVVADASSISFRLGSEVFAGTTIGVDSAADLAFVKVEGFPSGHEFALAPSSARTAEQVGVLGYPFGQPLGMTNGTVTSENLTIQLVDGSSLSGVFRTSAVINPGNSGGPVIDENGMVVGVVDAGEGVGNGFAMDVSTLSAALATWRGGDLAVVPPVTCPTRGEGALGGQVDLTITSTSPEAPSIAQTFQLYADAINAHYIDLAWEMLGPRMRAKAVDVATYARGLRTSSWISFDLKDVTVVNDHTDSARATFVTHQSSEWGQKGQTCSAWDLTYTLVLDQGFWQIDDAQLTNGPPVAC